METKQHAVNDKQEQQASSSTLLSLPPSSVLITNALPAETIQPKAEADLFRDDEKETKVRLTLRFSWSYFFLTKAKCSSQTETCKGEQTCSLLTCCLLVHLLTFRWTPHDQKSSGMDQNKKSMCGSFVCLDVMCSDGFDVFRERRSVCDATKE